MMNDISLPKDDFEEIKKLFENRDSSLLSIIDRYLANEEDPSILDEIVNELRYKNK